MYENLSFVEIKEFLTRNKKNIEKNFGIKSIGIFGSFVKGEANAYSDIDILIEFQKDKETFRNYMGLKFYLEEELNRKVDIIIKDSIKPLIKSEILKEVVYA
jgi:hypothetical protein